LKPLVGRHEVSTDCEWINAFMEYQTGTEPENDALTQAMIVRMAVDYLTDQKIHIKDG